MFVWTRPPDPDRADWWIQAMPMAVQGPSNREQWMRTFASIRKAKTQKAFQNFMKPNMLTFDYQYKHTKDLVPQAPRVSW